MISHKSLGIWFTLTTLRSGGPISCGATAIRQWKANVLQGRSEHCHASDPGAYTHALATDTHLPELSNCSAVSLRLSDEEYTSSSTHHPGLVAHPRGTPGHRALSRDWGGEQPGDELMSQQVRVADSTKGRWKVSGKNSASLLNTSSFFLVSLL